MSAIRTPHGTTFCLAVDMHNRDTRTHHLLCDKLAGHDGDHGNNQFTWPATPEPIELADTFHAIRRTDGELIWGEFSWMACDGSDDWTVAEEDDPQDSCEFEIVLMVPIVVARKTFPEFDPELELDNIMDEIQ